MREAPSVGQYIKQYDKQSGKHCGNKYVATTMYVLQWSGYNREEYKVHTAIVWLKTCNVHLV